MIQIVYPEISITEVLGAKDNCTFFEAAREVT